MRSIHQWLSTYAEDHQNPHNKRIHWVCVPLILWSILALLWVLPFPSSAQHLLGQRCNWALLAFVIGSLYYLALSWRLALGLIGANALLLLSCALLDQALSFSLGWLALGVFVLAWIGQFIGHHLEGRRPSFFTDLQFLLIGPAWLMAFLYRRIGLNY